jgi:hypothetical protein
MATASTNCRICKKIQSHKIVTVTDNLPPDVHVLECMGCGVLGVMRIDVEPEPEPDPNQLMDWMHTCPCGYSLKSAYGFLDGQKEVSRMLASHIRAMHMPVDKDV